MKNLFLVPFVLIASFGCQTNEKRLQEMDARLDQTRLRIYEVNLTACASIGASCMSLATQSGKDPENCGPALFGCVREAEDTYRKDTKKDPPGFSTKK